MSIGFSKPRTTLLKTYHSNLIESDSVHNQLLYLKLVYRGDAGVWNC